MSKEVVKKTKFNTLNTKAKDLGRKVPDETTLIHIDQYNTDKQNLKKKLGMLIKKYLALVI